MASPSNKGAKGVCSIFSFQTSSQDSSSTLSQPSASPNRRWASQDMRTSSSGFNTTLPRSSSIPNFSDHDMVNPHKSDGPKSDGPILPSINTFPISPPPPPSFLVKNGRPTSPSSHDSVQSSRAGSKGGSRGTPSSSITIVPDESAHSAVTMTRSKKEAKVPRKHSWRPKRSGQEVKDSGQHEPKAWIAGLSEQIPYDLSPIFQGKKVTELWSEKADTFVYLFPRGSGKGPSFKIPSSLFSGSRELIYHSRLDSNPSRDIDLPSVDPRALDIATQEPSSNDHDSHLSPRGSVRCGSNSSAASSTTMGLVYDFPDEDTEERHLYMPLELENDSSLPDGRLTSNDMEMLVLYRNFLAFLTGGALVATARQPTLYSIFLGIGGLLGQYQFSNQDGSTFGEVITNSFARYCDELRLADVRVSREKTIEAIVLGERMKSWTLYNEGFVHGAGKLAHIKRLHSPKYAQISAVTCNRLERAALDLDGRIHAVKSKLDGFEFPSMFAGIANSQKAVEAKMIRFKAWKVAFFKLRRHVISYYRHRFGAWPPRAKSEKNNFEESGLNRLLLQEVYQDFTDLYDLLADRTQLTNRTTEMAAPDVSHVSSDINESITHAIRRVESEYDRSTPPVQPPIPFDVPLLPSLSTSFYGGHAVDPDKAAKDRSRRFRESEVNELLLGSYNRQSIKATPLMEGFLRLERRSGRRCRLGDIVDTRCGHWIFIYAVLQSLPMLVVDARGIQFSEGVEYFLCISPRGGRPWMKEDTAQSRSWYNIASGGGIVHLPADVIDHSPEGIYRRSHCWTVAAEWASASEAFSPATQVSLGASLPPPPVINRPRISSQVDQNFGPAWVPSRSSSINQSPYLNAAAENRQSQLFSSGLEALPLPAGMFPDGTMPSRPISVHDPKKTFDSILGPSPKKGKKGI